MQHQIPNNLIEPLTSAPSTSRVMQVANMQNYIQDLLGETHFTFLQGSYKNDTAISDINDVDVVAMRLNTYSGTHSTVQVDQKIFWDQIFSEIEEKLRNQSRYDWTVERGDKCIKIQGAFNADVVPAVQVQQDQSFDPIAIYSFREGKEMLSHPRIHYQNGVDKNALTNSIYKPTVRMFKNWKMKHFGEDKDIVSSHKIEALVHHTEDSSFVDDPVLAFLLTANSIVEKLGGRGSGLAPISIPPIMSVCGQHDICSNWDYFKRTQFVDQLKHSLGLAYSAFIATSSDEAERNWRLAFKL